MAHPIRVLIVDDVPMLCAGLAFTLERGSAGAIAVVGTAHDGIAALDAVHAHRPDVVLMDIQMPRLDGLSATARLRQLRNPPEVIVITTFDADDEPVRAAHAGASGFLLKTEDPFEVIAAIKAVAAGEGALSRRTAKQLLSHVQDEAGGAERQAARRAFAALTARERDVADLVAKGLSNPQIAEALYLSESTVKTHLGAVGAKFGVTNRVLIAVRVTLALG